MNSKRIAHRCSLLSLFGLYLDQLKIHQISFLNDSIVFQVVYETAVQEKRIDNEADGSTVPGKKKSKADPSVFTSYESGKDSVYLEYREYDPSKVNW